MFSHNSVYHILPNMITLYFFGPTAAAVLSSRRYLTLYLGGGIASGLAHVNWPYVVPSHWPRMYKSSVYLPAMGASGAINAVVMYSILSFPRQIVYVNFILPMPAIVLGGLYVGMDVYGLYSSGAGQGGHVAHAAHLGGAAFGTLFFLLRRI